MGTPAKLSSFSELLLMVVDGLPDELSYGAPIYEQVSKALGRPLSIGAIYTGLDRLQERGLVTSWLGEATAVRGGKPKRYYQLTGEGAQALDEARAIRERARNLQPRTGMGWGLL